MEGEAIAVWALQSVILGAKVGLAIASCILTVRLALRLVSVVGAFDWVGKVVRAVGGAAKAVLGRSVTVTLVLGKFCLSKTCGRTWAKNAVRNLFPSQ